MKKNKSNRSIVSVLFVAIVSLFPRLGRRCWQSWYDYLAVNDQLENFRFMNYGLDSEEQINLGSDDERYRLQIQLYRHVVHKIDIKDKRLLEVGSGRGGGLDYIVRTFLPKSATGVDLSVKAISNCTRDYNNNRLTFQQGSADCLPIDDNSVDIVINVESSHCYPDMKVFINEVNRVLVSGGIFSICDMRSPGDLAKLEEIFNECGFAITEKMNITDNVLKALDKMSDTRIKISDAQPFYLKFAFRDFAGVKDSAVYDLMNNKKLTYISYKLVKH